MQTIAHDPVAAAVFVLLYTIAALTAAYILIKGGYKVPERLYWAGWVLQMPFWLCYFRQQQKK